MIGRVLQVNVSAGGVPKRPVPAATVRRLGLDGDRQASDTVHGGPHRAVCLLGIEAIRRVAAEGHPIAPGSVGENLTLEGIELGSLPAGSRLAIGAGTVLELADPASPCSTIAGAFSDGRSARISPRTHPRDARRYARVLREGTVQPGDRIEVLPPAEDSRALDHERLARLDAADRKSMLAIWRAAEATGLDLRIVEDHELLLCAAPGRNGGPLNGGFGFTTLPHLVGRGLDFFRRNGTEGWLELDADDPDAPEVAPDDERIVLAASPDRLAQEPVEGAASTVGARPTVSPVGRERAATWGETLHRALDEGTSLDWVALAPFMSEMPGTTLLLAELDGRPAGAATFQVHHGVAWLSGAGVVPEARGRGVHRALVAERIRLGIAAGCDLVGADADAGTRSEANLRAAGLVPIGRRARWRTVAFAASR